MKGFKKVINYYQINEIVNARQIPKEIITEIIFTKTESEDKTK